MNKYKAAVLAKFPKAKVFDLNGGHMLQATPPEFPNVYTFLHSEDVLWESAAKAWGCIPEEKQAAPTIDYEAEVRKQYGPYVLIKTTHVKTSTEDKRVLSAHVPDSSLYSALGEGSTVAEAWRNAYERITTPKTPGANDKLQADAKLVREYYIAPGTRGSIDCRASADGKRIELHFTNRYGTAVIGEGATEVEAWSNAAERLTSMRKAADKTLDVFGGPVSDKVRDKIAKLVLESLHKAVNDLVYAKL